MTPAPVELRDITRLEDCRAVVAVQEAVWGRDSETVPASVLFVSAKRGGILIGAYDASQLIGFVWSMPGSRDGVPVHWSHMLGVLPGHRLGGVAGRLKLAQRERALAAGARLIEWTFDPLQAANAHFNLHVLGAVGASYGVDVYGAMSGSLHRGTPTDRLVVEWRIREEARRPRAAAAGAPVETVPVPPNFSEMQQQAPDRAMEWRLAVREVMVGLFERGYLAVDFQLDREHGGGAYVFQRAKV